MAGGLVIVLQSEQPVEIALPHLIDVAAERPARTLRPPEDFAASASEHAFQIACVHSGENRGGNAETVVRSQMADTGFALCEILHEITADMRQSAVAGPAGIEIVVEAGFHGAG